MTPGTLRGVTVFSGLAHIFIGALAGGIFAAIMHLPGDIMVISALGALLPDVDHPKSLLGRFVKAPYKHRGYTHTFGCSLTCLIPILFFVNWVPCVLVWIGYISHLLADGTLFSKVSSR